MLYSMMRRGFTIVELAITITIMGILLTLAVVNLNATQANGRDAERSGDVEAVALNLENYYINQDPNVFMSGGTYPGSSYIGGVKQFLPDLDIKNAYAPGKADPDPISLVAATNTTTNPSGILPQPSKSNDVYVYQPLTANGTLCYDPFVDGDCRRFNLYYFQETTGDVHMITSKRQ